MLVLVAVLDERKRQRHERAWRNALRDANQPMNKAALFTEIDQGQLTRVLALQEGLLRKLAQLPDEFWQWLGVHLAVQFGLPREVRRGAKLRAVIVGRRRQARMALAEDTDRRSA